MWIFVASYRAAYYKLPQADSSGGPVASRSNEVRTWWPLLIRRETLTSPNGVIVGGQMCCFPP